MVITKSNKHKLSLDHDKPNEKGGCTLATLLALMRTLILDSQITITSLGSCSPLHSKGASQLNKWARVPHLDEWSKYLYPLIQNITFGG